MRSTVTAGLVVLLGVGACAQEEAEPEGGADMPAAATAPAPPEVRFTAKDFAFVGPDTIPAGMTTLVLRNEGPNLHHIQLLRLKDGKTLADLTAGLATMKPTDPPPPWVEEAGGVNPPEPGAEARATLMLDAGDYALVCFVDTPDHVAHVMKGMTRALTVTPSNVASAPAPTEDLTLTLVDFSFEFSAPPAAGRQVIKVVNGGPQPHEVAFFKLLPGKTMDDFAQWGATYEGPAPFTAVGGASAMAVGQVEWVTVDLSAGDYVAACFVFDATDGKPHLMHGMVLPFSVT